MILGLLLILLGVVFFLRNTGVIILPNTFWSLAWPLMFIVVGVYASIAAYRGRQCKHWLFGRWEKNNHSEQ